ncbi:glycosyltransferase [Microbacterium sp. ARD32]|uniref:glycosyltransferase n=1 Tax=Microbacterium sp. ARD32 TaxID=2962577 RepID=UPI002882C909|nr:glycosyltransferase [Microbacterium sp. ARD32]MDT0156757.1 glycosyltransferase [Microbacterium sp. ARD32]
MTRIALTKGSLRIPPTYFAVQHAIELAEEFDFEFFTMAAHVTDPEISAAIRIIDASAGTPFADGRRSWRQRERALPLLFRRMHRDIRDWDPGLIHQHFANWSQPAVAASRSTGAPLLLTVHGADVYVPLTPSSERNVFGKPMLRWHQRTVARAFDSATRILAVSEYLAGMAVRAGASAERVVVHYQGVDTDLYRPHGARPSAPPRVVFVGALSQAKGVRDLIEASAALASRVEHELVIVGDGPLRAEVEARGAEHAHVDVRGPLDRAGVLEALSGATVFVLPTQRSGRWREAAGLVSLEAQASGVPAIVYDSGGAAEMLEDGSTGRVVTESDIPALADAIRSVLTLPDAEWQAMSARAREFVVEKRSLRASAGQLAAHYHDLIEEGR